LEESVRCRMRSSSEAGILMSGGLDSGSVACLAARMIAPQQLTSISYVFKELSECDEREFINLLVTRYGLNSIQLQCDDLWPLRNLETWPHNPNFPEQNAYRLLKETAYSRANEEGIRVLLTGVYGDELYSGSEDWFTDLVMDGKWIEAIRQSQRPESEAANWRRLRRRLLDKLPGGAQLGRRRDGRQWLTSYAQDLLIKSKQIPQFELKEDVISVSAARDSAGEHGNAMRHAVELRHPYRDRRLVEFALSLPAFQFYRNGLQKHILRNAMKNILPEPIRTATHRIVIAPLFDRGMKEERSVLEKCVNDDDAFWSKFVKKEWLTTAYKKELNPEDDGPHTLIPWFCASLESWLRSSMISSNYKGDENGKQSSNIAQIPA